MDDTYPETYTSFDVAVAYDCGYRSGKEHEREQIVAWLMINRGGFGREAAVAIEAGEHLK